VDGPAVPQPLVVVWPAERRSGARRTRRHNSEFVQANRRFQKSSGALRRLKRRSSLDLRSSSSSNSAVPAGSWTLSLPLLLSLWELSSTPAAGLGRRSADIAGLASPEDRDRGGEAEKRDLSEGRRMGADQKSEEAKQDRY
jgi:hypothetical protein